MSELCGRLLEAMENFDEVEWGKYGPVIDDGGTDPYPPVTVWRYKEKDERRDQLIVDAVKSFNGDIQWEITFRDRESLPGRNWSIMPKRFQEFLNNFKENKETIKATGALSADGAFAVLEPEIGKAANRELPDLAEHIKNYVQKGLSVMPR
jgi:hypothetical protein